jgi:hypothetical protein
MNQLTKYIIALSHLYGVVHKDKVVEIYNSQNEVIISRLWQHLYALEHHQYMG